MSPVRSHVTRILHLLLLLVVIHQLGSSQIMERTFPGDEPGLPYVSHEWVGIAGLGVLTCFWIWTLLRDRSETSFVRLVPWFSSAGRAAVVEDVVSPFRALLSGKTPSFELEALASAVHGLGLALASFLALTGAAWYFVFVGTSNARTVMGLHSLAGNVMWAYLIGHALMGIAHQMLGDDVFSRMFWFRRRRESGVPASAE
jgi:cytochrome b561